MNKWTPPTIKKTLPCLRCGANTDQLLTPTREGCGWSCNSCKNTVPAFTHAQMIDLVTNKFFKLPEKPMSVDKLPEGLRVFIEHHSDPGVHEKEVAPECVLDHAKITGAWPEVGKPLFAVPGTIRNWVGGGATPPVGPTAKLFAVPYGKVVRVEGLKSGA